MSIWHHVTSSDSYPPDEHVTVTCTQIRGIHLSCHITSPTISAKHSYTKQYVKISKCRHTYDYYYGFDIALSAMYTILQKE